MEFTTVLRGEQRLGRLLADLLEHGIVTFCKQARDVGVARIGVLAAVDDLRQPAQDVGLYHGFDSPISGGFSTTGSVITHAPFSSPRKTQRPRPGLQANLTTRLP